MNKDRRQSVMSHDAHRDSYQYVMKLKANPHGRDFVIGDLHGCYDFLQKLMQHVEFDYKKDRLFIYFLFD